MDLNADLGESFGAWRLGDDTALLGIVTSANVACGFHAGDPLTIRRTIATAVQRGVAIGAQVSYPDLVGFGRRAMDVEPADLEACVLYQLAAVAGIAIAEGSAVRYVKPHGALYHRVLTDDAQAGAVLAAVRAFDSSLAVLTMAGVFADRAAASGTRVVMEGFADRAYTADGRLVPRTQAGAVLDDPEEVAQQALRLADSGRIESICLHGDTPHAVDLAVAVRDRLERAGVSITSFA
jgi:5-oxoprolinase (ATP-hydrolysing) subunit A